MSSKKIKIQPKWPKSVEEGLIRTENAMGFMTLELSPAAKQFVADAAKAKQPMLDIGSAYGSAVFPALENGATVIACDMSNVHLNFISDNTPAGLKSHLILKHATFPKDLDFEAQSLSGILMSQILHFLDGETLELGLHKCFQWLEKGGRIYIVVITPFLSRYILFLDEFNERLAQGESWPGAMNPRLVVKEDHKNQLPEFIQLFNTDIIQRVVEKCGFKIEKNEYFCFSNIPEEHRNNGKEFISLVARKP